MSERPIVHIGFHKTATSWFQAYFYPALTSHRHINRLRVREILLGGTAFQFDVAAARRALGFDDPGPPPVLCDEDLSGILHNGGVATTFLARAIAERIHAVAPQAQIVIFVREQVAMAAACYNQYLREGGTGSPRRYLFPEDYRHLTKMRPFKTPRFDFAQFDYLGLIGHYDALFGRENVHVFAYEAFACNHERFLRDFSVRLGLAGTTHEISRIVVNPSYRRGLLPIARFLNLFTARSVADKRVLIHVPFWYPVRKWLLAQCNRWPIFGRPIPPGRLLGCDTAAWIRARFAPMNRALSARMGVDLAALGYSTKDNSLVSRPRRVRWLRWLRN